MAEIRVLCVDPDRAHRSKLVEAVQGKLDGTDAVVEKCESGEEATPIIADGPVDCLVTEHHLPDSSGLELADRVRKENPDASVVLYTDTDPDELAAGTDGTTVTEYIDKAAPAAPTRAAALIKMSVTFRTQASYPIPEEEEARLAALTGYEFEDGPLNDAFDRLTDLAMRHLDISSASVNIIEEHEQRLLACRGLDADRTSRDASICTFTIVEDDRVMTVPDVREDPRFQAKHEELEALGIRSYMGAQLLSPDGYRIGTLCVYDDQPHEFSRRDQEYLRTLAELGVDLLAAHAGTERQDDEAMADEAGKKDGATDSAGDAGTDEDGMSALGEAFE